MINKNMSVKIDFKNWISLNENKEVIDDLFARTEAEISKYFDELYKAVARTWGKGSMPIGKRVMNNIVLDLEKILERLKKPLSLKNESINEAITQGLSAAREGDIRQFNLRDVLDNIKRSIMGSMQRLKNDLVMNKLGGIERGVTDLGDLTSKGISDLGMGQSSLKTGQEDIGGKLGRVRGEIGKVRSDLARSTGFGIKTSDEEEQAFQSMSQIANFLKDRRLRPDTARLVSVEDETPLTMSLRTGDWEKAKEAAYKDKRMRILYRADPKEDWKQKIIPIDQPSLVASALDQIEAEVPEFQLQNFVPSKVSGNKLRKLKVRNPKKI